MDKLVEVAHRSGAQVGIHPLDGKFATHDLPSLRQSIQGEFRDFTIIFNIRLMRNRMMMNIATAS